MASGEGAFVVQKRVVDGVTVVTLAGELDLAAVPELGRELSRASDATRPDVVVDLRQVTFMDCSALGVVLRTHKQVTAAGGCLRLTGTQRGPRRVLGLCQLDSVLCAEDSNEAAGGVVATGTSDDLLSGQT
jgi:anti-anti-sigma factor